MFWLLKRPTFITGVAIGVVLAILFKPNQRITPTPITRPFQLDHYQSWFEKTKLLRRPLSFDALRHANNTHVLESQFLRSKIRVLCLVLVTKPNNAQAIEHTWGKHCNELNALNLTTHKRMIPLKRNRNETSWILLCNQLKRVPDKFNWILVVHDSTFAVVENLRMFVASLNSNDKYYLGHAVKFWNTFYNLGEAGFVLSRGGLEAFKKKLGRPNACQEMVTYVNKEDYYLGLTLASLNITPVDTRDGDGLSTFHPQNLHRTFSLGDQNGFRVFPYKCCSSFTIAFNSIEGDKMYTYYYLLYNLQVFLSGQLGNKLPKKTISDDQVWRNFLKARDISENISSKQYYKIWENIIDDPTSFARNMKREEYFDYSTN